METFSTIVLKKVLATLFNRSFGKHEWFTADLLIIFDELVGRDGFTADLQILFMN